MYHEVRYDPVTGEKLGSSLVRRNFYKPIVVNGVGAYGSEEVAPVSLGSVVPAPSKRIDFDWTLCGLERRITF